MSLIFRFCPLTVPEALVKIACVPAVALCRVTPPKHTEPKDILLVTVTVLPACKLYVLLEVIMIVPTVISPVIFAPAPKVTWL